MPTLAYCDVDGVDRTLEIGATPVSVGRSPDCTIKSDDQRCSRHHARFTLESGFVWVEDLGSANGVWVGPQRVSRAPVPVGELVLIGSLVFRVVDPRFAPQAQPGTHAQLCEWLLLERKAKGSAAAERDALAKRLGGIHEELEAARAEARAARQQATEAEARASAAAATVRDAEARAEEAEEKLRGAEDAAPPAGGGDTDRVARLEGELAALRRRLEETDAELDEFDRLKVKHRELEQKLAAAPAAAAAGSSPTGAGEQIAVLREAIGSLRASMRAVSDETAVMDPSDSLQVVVTAVASATGEIERAREALRALDALVGS